MSLDDSPRPAPGIPRPALPGALLHRPRVHAAELGAIIERSWQAVGHESDLPEVGSRIVGTSVPTRSWSSEERTVSCARSATCAGTAARSSSGSGDRARRSAAPTTAGPTASTARCSAHPRHGRSPASTSRRSRCCPARVETLLGFVFVNLDVEAADRSPPRCPASRSGRRATSRATCGRSARRGCPTGRLRCASSANWKIVVDNYLEGYHVPAAHPGLMRLLDYQRYAADIHDGYVWVEAPMRPEPSKQPRRAALPAHRVDDARACSPRTPPTWRYCLIYPNTALEFYPGHGLRLDDACPTASELS